MDLLPLFSLHLVLVGVLFPIVLAAQTLSKPGCPDKCGNVSIPFPFGVGDDCYLNSYFNITCDNSTGSPKTYLNKTFEVSDINVDGQLSILSKAARNCYNDQGFTIDQTASFGFTVSKSRNKFTVIGCDSYGYVWVQRGKKGYNAGCFTSCLRIDDVDDSSCSGSGCCQIDIPDGLYQANVSAYNFNDLNVSDFSPCTYSFIVDEGKFNFSGDYLKNMRGNDMFPVVLDWWVEEDKKARVACKGNATKLVEKKIPVYIKKKKKNFHFHDIVAYASQVMKGIHTSDAQTLMNVKLRLYIIALTTVKMKLVVTHVPVQNGTKEMEENMDKDVCFKLL